MTAAQARLSAECRLAAQGDKYVDLHGQCRQTRDVPLPHSEGLLLIRGCPCTCHVPSGGGMSPA